MASSSTPGEVQEGRVMTTTLAAHVGIWPAWLVRNQAGVRKARGPVVLSSRSPVVLIPITGFKSSFR
jgi:hypothetical protein